MAITRTLAAVAALIVIFVVSLSLFHSAEDLRPRFLSISLPYPSVPAAPCPASDAGGRTSPLRVFMYDLPIRFNVGMLGGAGSNGTAAESGGRPFPAWPSNGIRRQHSVEYWLMASLMVDGGGDDDEREAVRVLDGEEAEVFFVPFFSSLSFNVHGRFMTDPETETDHQLQRDLLELLRKSKHWQRSAGRDHVIPMNHPNAFRFLRDQVNASILLVSDFGRYPRYLSSLSKDVVSPYVHVVDSFVDDDPPDPFGSRPTLLFFRGRTVRKDDGIVRSKLAKVLRGHDDVHYENSFATGEGIEASKQGMRSSKFCLHPSGDTPSSCRLFDAIVSHCVPVIVSDHIELPFEDEVDYTQFAIFFSTRKALEPGYMVRELRKVSKERWLQMWRALKNISHHYEFQSPPKREDAVNMLWRQVRHKLPAVKLAMHRDERLMIPDWWD